MSDLSRIALTLSDYATSVAKNFWGEKVTALHLFAAIRRWDQDQFDKIFVGIDRPLEGALARSKGDSIKPSGLDEPVKQALIDIEREGDVWDLAKRLHESLAELLDDKSSSELSPTQVQTLESEDLIEPNKEVLDTSHQRFQSKSFALLLNSELANQVATILGSEIVSVKNSLANDAYSVAHKVLGHVPEELSMVIKESLDHSMGDNGNNELSQFVKVIASTEHDSASRIATKVALALVDVGEYSAALDASVTKDEIDRIDTIRLELRNQLAEKVDVASDAILEFELKFSHLVGMESVKSDLRKRVDFLMVNKRREARGRKTDRQRMHMAFVGNPGTGKTTVARLYAELLQNSGLLPLNKVIETDRSGMVGEYIGHTEKKTKNVIKQADGGVLFVDEAYALNDRYSNSKGFGEEAVDVLVKEMEDRRDSLVVVFAGYKLPMLDFIDLNPGLRSRIPTIIEFPDYSEEELIEIAHRIASSRDLIIDVLAEQKLKHALNLEKEKVGFGNARAVENILDQSQRNATLRMSHLGNLATEIESRTILAEDVELKEELVTKKQIGFSARSADRI
jgi:stage V sporulation protein K